MFVIFYVKNKIVDKSNTANNYNHNIKYILNLTSMKIR